MYKPTGNKGFTLIELLVVIAIIGILAAAAVTTYIGAGLKADRSEAYSGLNAIRMMEEQFFAENGVYTVSFASLPGFTPGAAGLNYNYALMLNVELVPPVPVPFGGAVVALSPCFVATATGVAGTRAAGDVFAIDCNGDRNF